MKDLMHILVFAVVLVPGAAQAARFTDNGNGTVTDNVTGLIWQQEDDNTTRTWLAALAYCEALSLGGQIDWRLPNRKELRSIVKDVAYSPAIDRVAFPNTKTSGYYLSSSTRTGSPNFPWSVYFGSGVTHYDYKTNTYYVRCVR